MECDMAKGSIDFSMAILTKVFGSMIKSKDGVCFRWIREMFMMVYGRQEKSMAWVDTRSQMETTIKGSLWRV